jgi:hypothetical protein
VNGVEIAIAKVLPDLFGEPLNGGAIVGRNDLIPEGRRDSTLTQVAGGLRRLGLPSEAIAAALEVENQRRCVPPLSDFEIKKIARSVGRYSPSAPIRSTSALVGYTLAELANHVFPIRKTLFMRGDTPVFRAADLGELYADRGVGKTWVSMTLGVTAATGSEALGFRAPSPCKVVYIDGEMASSEIKERFALLEARIGKTHSSTLTVVAADWQEEYLPRLDTTAGQTLVEPFIADADLIILDNRSSLFDPNGEKDPTAWQPAQDWLLSLRRRGKAVLVVHHSNRTGGARGHSKAEDPMNLLIKLARPEDYQQDQGARFLVTFEKSRSAYGSAVAPFLARLTPDGWEVDAADRQDHTSVSEKLLAQVRLAQTVGEAVKSANRAISAAKVRRKEGLAAWASLLKSGAILKDAAGDFHAS